MRFKWHESCLNIVSNLYLDGTMNIDGKVEDVLFVAEFYPRQIR